MSTPANAWDADLYKAAASARDVCIEHVARLVEDDESRKVVSLQLHLSAVIGAFIMRRFGDGVVNGGMRVSEEQARDLEIDVVYALSGVILNYLNIACSKGSPEEHAERVVAMLEWSLAGQLERRSVGLSETVLLRFADGKFSDREFDFRAHLRGAAP